MSITIRRAGPEDAAALRDLHAMPHAQAGTLQLPFPSLQQWEQKLTPRDGIYSLLAEWEGEVAGRTGPEASPGSEQGVHVGKTTPTVVFGQGSCFGCVAFTVA